MFSVGTCTSYTVRGLGPHKIKCILYPVRESRVEATRLHHIIFILNVVCMPLSIFLLSTFSVLAKHFV